MGVHMYVHECGGGPMGVDMYMSVVGVLWVYIHTYVHECGGGFVGVHTYVRT